MSDEDLVDELINFLNHMIWIVVDAAAVLIGNEHFFNRLSRQDPLSLLRNDEDSRCENLPDGLSLRLCGISHRQVGVCDHVEYYLVPDAEQGLGMEHVAVEACNRVIDQRLHGDAKIL